MLVSLRRFKIVLPPFPPHLMIRYQSRHLESTLNQFISFVFNHPPRFELSTMRRRRRRRHWGRGERGRTKEITEESIVEIFFLQCPISRFAFIIPCILIKQSYGIPPCLFHSKLPSQIIFQLFTLFRRQPASPINRFLKEEWKYGEPALDND